MQIPPTDAGFIDLILAMVDRSLANKDALKAYGIDLSAVQNNELHADVLAVLAQVCSRDGQAARDAIKGMTIHFMQDATLTRGVADAGLDGMGRNTIRLNPVMLMRMPQAERRHVIAHELAHCLQGHHQMILAVDGTKAYYAVIDAVEIEANNLAAAWGF